MAAKAEISVASSPGLVSIVIPCCGMLEYTRLCVPSILRYSRPPFELIFVDIGSLDGTAEYLQGLRAGLATQMRVDIVRTATDLGLNDACRQALEHTLGEFIVLLNNDTIVTPGWLNQLTGLAAFSMTIGMVGPMSNMAPEAQLVETVPYRVFASTRKSDANPSGALVDSAAIEKFALEFHKANQGKWIHHDRLGGFCVLIKREVLDKIGPALDEWSDLRLFDSDILSSKARQLGYSPAICRDVFVHHFGTRTFAHGSKPANSSPSQT